MVTGKQINSCLLWIALTAAFANAKHVNLVRFTGNGGDSDWNNAANWETGVVPGEMNEAGIVSGTVKITNEVTVAYLRNGMSETEPAEVIIDGGTLHAVGTDNCNAPSYGCTGAIIIGNGGSASFNDRFYVGYKDTPNGSVTIYDGTLCVVSGYFHNKGYSGTNALGTRTTINPGGLLDVDELVLNAGVMDIAGGTLIVRRNIAHEVDRWVANGRMIAMGGAEGWKIEAIRDEATGAAVVFAAPTGTSLSNPAPPPVPERKWIPAPKPSVPPPEPAPKPELPPELEPFTVGMLNPVLFVSDPLAS